MPKAHPANVPGDFYVEDRCCTRCGVPQIVAPELFPPDDDIGESCWVRKQPSTETELSRMLKVIHDAELQCIRYQGTDRSIQTQLVKTGDGAACDSLPEDLEVRRGPWRWLDRFR